MTGADSSHGLLQRVPVAVVVFALMAIGLVAGIRLFPIPPYDNVGPAAAVGLGTIFVGTLAFLEVKTRYAE